MRFTDIFLKKSRKSLHNIRIMRTFAAVNIKTTIYEATDECMVVALLEIIIVAGYEAISIQESQDKAGSSLTRRAFFY